MSLFLDLIYWWFFFRYTRSVNDMAVSLAYYNAPLQEHHHTSGSNVPNRKIEWPLHSVCVNTYRIQAIHPYLYSRRAHASTTHRLCNSKRAALKLAASFIQWPSSKQKIFMILLKQIKTNQEMKHNIYNMLQ